MKLKKPKYKVDLLECKKHYDLFCDEVKAYDRVERENSETTIRSMMDTEEVLVYIFHKMLKEVNVNGKMYREVCCDCIRYIMGIEDEDKVWLYYKCMFCYEDEILESYDMFEKDKDGRLGNFWKLLFFNSLLHEEDCMSGINHFMKLFSNLCAAIGIYLVKKLDARLFEHSAIYLAGRIRISISQYIEWFSKVYLVADDELREKLFTLRPLMVF